MLASHGDGTGSLGGGRGFDCGGSIRSGGPMRVSVWGWPRRFCIIGRIDREAHGMVGSIYIRAGHRRYGVVGFRLYSGNGNSEWNQRLFEYYCVDLLYFREPRVFSFPLFLLSSPPSSSSPSFSPCLVFGVDRWISSDFAFGWVGLNFVHVRTCENIFYNRHENVDDGTRRDEWRF